MQPWDQKFKISLKKWTCELKNGVLFKKKPKNLTFLCTTWETIQEWGCSILVDRYGT